MAQGRSSGRQGRNGFRSEGHGQGFDRALGGVNRRCGTEERHCYGGVHRGLDLGFLLIHSDIGGRATFMAHMSLTMAALVLDSQAHMMALEIREYMAGVALPLFDGVATLYHC